MKFDPDEIVSVIRSEIANYRGRLDVQRIGRVLEVGDGIAVIYGLTEAMAGEMLEFESGARGQVFNLQENSVGAVVYGDYGRIKAGETVRATGKLLEVPVGSAMLGRVINPLGEAIDAGEPIECEQNRPVDLAAPGMAARQPVTEPLHTGIMAIDALTPIGRGQRELIIGDRKTGKTAIALDTIINQRDTDVICLYVAIGQKDSTVAALVETLRTHGAMDHTIVVSAGSSDPAPLKYIAPYVGCTIAEHFMTTEGRATLVVYDDLTKQAAAYREISLLLRRPPGREAYPGDVFYLHSRLLERACKLAEKYVIAPAHGDPPAEGIDGQVYEGPIGRAAAEAALAKLPGRENLAIRRLPGSGGSMTALPICETQEGEVSAYIPTNLISITDGQIYLEPGLFFSGVRPAINVGISVSRVGYKAASQAMKDVAKSLRLELAAYRELESFAQLGMELDETSQRQLNRGARLVRLLTQGQYQPQPVVDQVLGIYAGTGGYMDDVAVEDVHDFHTQLRRFVRAEHAEFYEAFEVQADATFTKQREKELQRILEAFKATAWREFRRQRRAASAEGAPVPKQT